MKAKRRIYVVNGSRLVKAYGQQAARNLVARDTINVELASQETLIELIGRGVKVETTDAPEQTEIPCCAANPQPDPPPVINGLTDSLNEVA
jgi:hypothetical protein